jgi:hypothetical protein
MHRQRTRLASRVTRVASAVGSRALGPTYTSRVNRVATAVERRGIAATYELHDRLLSNRRSRRRYASESPTLTDVQRQVIDQVGVQGYAVVPFADLLGGEELWREIEERGQTFIATTEEGLEREAAGASTGDLRRRKGKDFLVRAFSFEGARLGPDEPWFRACVSRQMLDVANAYLQLWSKLSYVDLWYSIPQPPDTERVASQTWHFDFDDRHLLKAFLYLTDVDANAGPFEYVAGSQPGGPFHSVRPWRPMEHGRVPEDEVTRRVPSEEIRTFTAPRGTVIFCNTSGLHRGGFAVGKPRVLATATYCSPASLAALSERNFIVDDSEADKLEPVARHAVT